MVPGDYRISRFYISGYPDIGIPDIRYPDMFQVNYEFTMALVQQVGGDGC